MNNTRFSRKILVSVILCALLTISTVFAIPEQGITGVKTVISYTSDGQVFVSVSGKSSSVGEQMVFVTMNPDCLPENIGDGDKTSIRHQDVIEAAADNKFEYKFSIKDVKDIQEGTYSVYAGSYSNAREKIADISILNETGMQTLVAQVTGADKSGLISLFNNDAEKLGVHNFVPFNAVNKEKLAETIGKALSAVDKSGTIFDTYNNLVKIVKSYSVIEAFNQKKADSILDESGNFLYTDVIGFNKIEETEKTDFIACFNITVSDNAQNLIVDNMFEKAFESPEDAYEEYAKNVVLYGIHYPKLNGYGHIEDLLTANNCEYLGIDIDGSLTNSRQKKLAEYQQIFSSIDELEKFINDIDTGNGGGGDGGGGSGGSGGGFGVVKKHELEREYKEQLEQIENVSNIFDDVSETHWAAEAIASLKEKNVLNGENEKIYNPDGLVTREQFVKILCTASETEISDEQTYEEVKFLDVNTEEWYAPYVCTAYELGIVSGISDEVFGTGQSITRQDLCVMAYRTFSIDGADGELSFADSALVDDYAATAVKKLVAEGIVNGYEDGSFRPDSPCTRAEAAQIIYRIIKRGE